MPEFLDDVDNVSMFLENVVQSLKVQYVLALLIILLEIAALKGWILCELLSCEIRTPNCVQDCTFCFVTQVCGP